MQPGAQTPWGSAQNVEQLGDEVWIVDTAGHGGVHMTGAALRAVPAEVGITFINGPGWAEEDCEACIALAILEQRGLIEPQRLEVGVDALQRYARAVAEQYPRYQSALDHLPPAGGGKRTAAAALAWPHASTPARRHERKQAAPGA